MSLLTTAIDNRAALAAYFVANPTVWIELSDTPGDRFDVTSPRLKLPKGSDAQSTHLAAGGILADEIDEWGNNVDELIVPYNEADPSAISQAYAALQFAINWTPETSRYCPIIHN